jgi:WD40 repeat protein
VRFASGATGALERALLTPYEYGCRAIAFSPDGGTVYADMDGTHAYARGKDLGVFSGDEGNVSQLAVSPSGKLLAIGHHYHPVTIWDARKRTLVATVATPDSPSALAFSRDGKELLVGGPDGVLRAFETTGWTEVGALPTHSDLVDVAVADGGKVLATADRTGLVRSWDAATGALLGSRLFGDYPSLAAVDGGLVVHGDDLRAVDARTLADAGAAIPVSGAKLSSSRDGTRVALVDGHTLQLVDVKAGSVQAIEWGTQYADAIAMDPKGRFIAAGGMSGALRFYDGDGKERGGGRSGVVRAVAFSPSEPLVFVAARQDADLCLALEVPSGKERWRNDDASPGDVIAVSPDGKLVAFGDHDGFHFLDAATGLEVALLPTDRAAYVRVLAFSADGKALYANDDRTVLAWDTSFIR